MGSGGGCSRDSNCDGTLNIDREGGLLGCNWSKNRAVVVTFFVALCKRANGDARGDLGARSPRLGDRVGERGDRGDREDRADARPGVPLLAVAGVEAPEAGAGGFFFAQYARKNVANVVE